MSAHLHADVVTALWIAGGIIFGLCILLLAFALYHIHKGMPED